MPPAQQPQHERIERAIAGLIAGPQPSRPPVVLLNPVVAAPTKRGWRMLKRYSPALAVLAAMVVGGLHDVWLTALGLVLLGQEAEGASAAKTAAAEAARAWQVGSPAAAGTVEKLAFSASGGSGSSIALALLEDNGSNAPGTVLVEGSVAFSGKGSYEVAVAATEVKPTVKYWLAVVASGGSLTFKPATGATWLVYKNSTPTKVPKIASVTSWSEMVITEVGGPISIWAIGKEVASHTHTLSATQEQAAVIARAPARKLPVVAQAQALTMAKSPVRVLSKAQPQTLTMKRSPARTLPVAQAQAPVMARALARKLPVIAQAQVTAMSRSLARTLPLIAQAQTVTLAHGSAKAHTLSASVSQTATRIVVPTRVLAGAQTQTPALARGVVRVVGVTQPQVARTEVMLARAMSLLVSTIPSRRTALARVVATSQPQAVARTTGVARALSVAQSQTVARRAALARVIALTQPQSASMTGVPEHAGLTLSISQGQAVSFARAPSRTLSSTQATVTSRRAGVARTLALGASTSAFCVRQVHRNLSCSNTTAAALSSPVSRTLAPPQSIAVSFGRDLARALGLEVGVSVSVAGTIPTKLHPPLYASVTVGNPTTSAVGVLWTATAGASPAREGKVSVE